MLFSKLKNKFKTYSLKLKIRKSYALIIGIMIVPTVFSFFISRFHSNQYDQIISNVGKANEISQIVKYKIPNELWDVVSGRTTLNNSRHIEFINDIKYGIDEIIRYSGKNSNIRTLEVANRAIVTLESNIEELTVQITLGGTVHQNENKLDDIRSISGLLSDILQDYVISEIETASITNKSIKQTSIILALIQIAIFIIALGLAFFKSISVSLAISRPIRAMEELSTKIAGGDFDAKVEPAALIELKTLSENLNVMGEKLNMLVKQNIEKQKNLQKAELKTLQAQITPHFLYNTFDTIIWLAEEGENDEVIKITRAFSQFLRTSLSRGHEWITVKDEIEYVRNYLTIQKVRYGSILNYEINDDESLCDFQMLKLTLQPLVENAIYHGIKNKRGRGNIKVTAAYTDESKKFMKFTIEDNGIGFTEEKLNLVRKELNSIDDTENLKTIYGMYNVNKRLLLYYGEETEGIFIESIYGKGSIVHFTVPCRENK